LLACSLTLTAAFVLVDRGALIYNTRDGHALWLLATSRPVNLTYAWPSLFRHGPAHAWALAAAWVVPAAVAWLLLRRVELGGVSYGPWRAAALAAAAMVVVSGATLGSTIAGGADLDRGAAALGVLARGCRDDARAVRTHPFTVTPAREALTGVAVADASRRLASPDAGRWSAIDVPPGRYRLAVASGSNVTGVAEISLGRPDAVLSRCDLQDQPPGLTACEIALPAGASALWVAGDSRLARSGQALSLVADAPGPAAHCDARASRALVQGDATWFVVGGRAWVERGGMWSAGGRRVQLVAGGTPGKAVPMRIRQGAAAGLVRVSAGSWDESRELAAGRTWDLEVPPAAEGRAAAFSVETYSAFRPLDHDPGSTDSRVLGVWIEPR
jgi:hypothetical protein